MVIIRIDNRLRRVLHIAFYHKRVVIKRETALKHIKKLIYFHREFVYNV